MNKQAYEHIMDLLLSRQANPIANAAPSVVSNAIHSATNAINGAAHSAANAANAAANAVLNKSKWPFNGKITPAPMPESEPDPRYKDTGIEPTPKFEDGVLYKGSEITEQNDPVWAIKKSFGGKYTPLEPNRYYRYNENKPKNQDTAVFMTPSWEPVTVFGINMDALERDHKANKGGWGR